MNKFHKILIYSVLFATVIAVLFVSTSHFRSERQAVHIKPQNSDYKRMGRQESEISNAVGRRMLEEAAECDKKGLSKQERARRVHAIYLAGKAEINRVRSSNYTVPFNRAVLETANTETP